LGQIIGNNGIAVILFALGLPGRFGDWCEAVITRMAEQTLGKVRIIAPNSAEELAIAMLGQEGCLLVTGRQPGTWLQRVIQAAGKNVAVALDDPRKTLAELMAHNGLGLTDAVRQVGSGSASVLPWLDLPRSLVLHAERDWLRAVETASALARHFELPISSRDIENIVSDLAAAGLEPGSSPTVSALDHIGEAALRVVNGALAPYANLNPESELNAISWGRDLFMMDGHQPATEIVDICGRVRALFYGPYIKLPPGQWLAEIVLGFSREATEMNFVIDILMGGTQIAVTKIQPAHEGIFSVNLSFVVEEGNDHAVEFRVVNERAAFDGKIALGEVTLVRQGAASGSAIDLLKTQLGLS